MEKCDKCIQNLKLYNLMGRDHWHNHIKMDLKEIRWEPVNWINVAQDRDR
jgi:hypothetical protein